jgi:uncharacterized protein
VHEKNNININLEEVNIIIYGHSHKYSLDINENIIYLNPESCGRKRFSLHLTMAIMNIINREVQIEKIDLNN